jgi:hypothetical protein
MTCDGFLKGYTSQRDAGWTPVQSAFYFRCIPALSSLSFAFI